MEKQSGNRIKRRISNFYAHKKHIYLKNIIINVQDVVGGEVNKYTNNIPLEVEHIDGNYQNNKKKKFDITMS